MTYYLLSSPETIVSLVRTGRLYATLPASSESGFISCSRNIQDCLASKTLPDNETFVIEINIPDKRESNRFIHAGDVADPYDFVVLRDFEPGWIIKTRAITTAGQILLNNLLSSSLDRYGLWGRKSLSNHQLELISSREEHINLIKKAFAEAKRKILITSRGIQGDLFRLANLDQLITKARAENVEIYIYYSDHGKIDSEIVRFLERLGVHVNETFTHSKILAVDHRFISIGSFNWLEANTRYQAGEEGSFFYSGPECKALVEESWQHIKHYRNIQFSNFRLVSQFVNDQEMQKTLTIDIDQSELSYLATLEQHRGFIGECFKSAKSRIIIGSPFVNHQFKFDISIHMIKDAIRRGVDIYLLYQPLYGHESILQSYFNRFLISGKVHLLPANNFHTKILIVDDKIMSQGSYNWLSADRDIESPYHNHEVSLVIEGEKASRLIGQFFSQTRLGKAIENQILFSNGSYRTGT
jgi:hypothetical protein